MQVPRVEWYKCGGKDQGAWWVKTGRRCERHRVEKRGRKNKRCVTQWPDAPEGLTVRSSDHTCRLWLCDGQAVMASLTRK